MRRSLGLFALLSVAAVIPSAARPQGQARGTSIATATHASHDIPVPSAIATLRNGDIAIDGKLDESAWRAATPITEFTQFDPDAGQPGSERTEVRFLFDDAALYVFARMWDSLGPAGVKSTVVRRDNPFNSDFFEIVIDGYHDHLSRAFFQVNPSGSRNDQLGIGTSCCDPGWDPVWAAATSIDAEGWSAEIRIPFSQLRFSRDSVQTWGLQVRRFIQRRNEVAQWASWGRTEIGGPARFGHLEGIRIGSTSRGLELLPYAMTKSANVAAAPGDPFHSGSQQSLRAGLDLKYLLTTNLTLDATINPDFGQVEVDPAVVNLSAFETFFQERRPFFVSGSGVFGYGGFNCYFCSNVSSLQAFYSRRIGRAPTGADLAYAQGQFADVPEASTILGAAKITGRTANGYTIGVLNAVTGKAEADVQRADGTRIEQEVEPLSNYFVGRLKKDYLRGDLVVGGIVTSVVRDLSDPFVSRLSRHAELIGTDVRYTWNNRQYSLIGNFAVSNVEGDSTVILARQLSSARFYQRPDRSEGSGGFFAARLDSSATAMRGYGGYARLGKDAGNWLWETAVNVRNPGFETNDYSFLTTSDYIWHNANIFRFWSTPTTWYRNLSVILGGQQQYNYDGDLTTNTQTHAFVGGQTPQFWNWSTFYIWYPGGVIDDRLLRGGPSVKSFERNFYSLNVSTDSRKSWQLSTTPSASWNERDGYSSSHNVSLTVRPSTRVLVSFGPSYGNSRNKTQFIPANVTDPTATAFGGRRYILSDLHQKSLGLDTRFNVTFSPTMTFELYAQPFFSSAHFTEFKEFDRPRDNTWSVYGRDRGTIAPVTNANGRVTSYTIDPDGTGEAAPFTIQNPDFNFRSLRGNAVFRWEYRPGSTLFFAWTQSRSNTGAVGDFDFARDREALLDSKPDNIFLVKASWWLSR